MISETYLLIEGGRTVALGCEYAGQYAAGGDEALIDYIRGTANYRTGQWQGYQGQDFEAVVDLGSARSIDQVTIGFLQDIKSWIWYPTEVSFELSTDGTNFAEKKVVTQSFPSDQYGAFTQDHTGSWGGQDARYVRVRAKSFGTCPDWHLGAGGDTWLFADEIVIETKE